MAEKKREMIVLAERSSGVRSSRTDRACQVARRGRPYGLKSLSDTSHFLFVAPSCSEPRRVCEPAKSSSRGQRRECVFLVTLEHI